MTKRTKNRLVSITASFAIALGIVGAATATAPTAVSAAGNENTTLVMDTSFRTRVTTQLTKQQNAFRGASIEFDLLSSDLKSEENIVGKTIPSTTHTTGVSEAIAELPNRATKGSLGTWNYAGITFNFYEEDALVDISSTNYWNWRSPATFYQGTQHNQTLGSFTYYADGSIVEFKGHTDNGATRTDYVHKPTDETFVGTAEDVASFMNEGYSYKVSIVWGHVDEDKTITTANNNSEAWYVAYSKTIDAEDYDVLFAFKISNPTLRSGYGLGVLSQAGFEIHANYANPRSGQLKADGFSNMSNNVKMEMDNISIYDGYDKATAPICRTLDLDFENANELALEANPDTVQSSTAAGNNGYWSAWCYTIDATKTTNSSVTVNGIKVQSANLTKEIIEAPASRTISSRTMREVKYVSGSKVLYTTYVPDGCAITLPKEIDGVAYNWQVGEIDTTKVTQDLVIEAEYTFGDKLSAMNVAVAENVITRFYYTISPELKAVEGAVMKVAFDGKAVEEVALADWTAEQDGRYMYEYKLAAAEMTKKITMQFVAGGEEGKIYSLSVRDYADGMLANQNTTQAQKDMINAMLNYGAYAQEFFSADEVATEDLANYGIANNVESVTDETLMAFKANSLAGEVEGLVVSGYEVYLDYTTKVRVFFTKVGENQKAIEDYTFTVNGKSAQALKLGEKYYVEVEVAAAELDEELTFTVSYGEQTLTLKTSVLSYAGYAIGTQNVELKNLLKALYLYNQAANALFNV